MSNGNDSVSNQIALLKLQLAKEAIDKGLPVLEKISLAMVSASEKFDASFSDVVRHDIAERSKVIVAGGPEAVFKMLDNERAAMEQGLTLLTKILDKGMDLASVLIAQHASEAETRRTNAQAQLTYAQADLLRQNGKNVQKSKETWTNDKHDKHDKKKPDGIHVGGGFVRDSNGKLHDIGDPNL